MGEPDKKKNAPIWPLIALFLILAICIPLSIPLGMGASVNGWHSTDYMLLFLLIGAPLAVFGIALYIYIKKIISENSFNSKLYLILSIFLLISPLILVYLVPNIIRLIKRAIFYLSFFVLKNSFIIILYIFFPFLLFVILGYGIACIFENKKRISGFIITLIIFGILIFAEIDEKREQVKYNCFSEKDCEINIVISKNDITKCDSITCIYRFVNAKLLKPEDCLVLGPDHPYYANCVAKAAIVNNDIQSCNLIKNYRAMHNFCIRGY
jgi:hypothetical protein